jgi:hypothetical protein
MLLVACALALLLALSANAHLWWDTPAAGTYPAHVQPMKTLSPCISLENSAAPSTLAANASGPFSYDARINPHGGGQFTAMWFPATEIGSTGTYSYGAGVNMNITSGGTFTNVSWSALVVGTYPAAVSGDAMIQLDLETVQQGTYIACRWASALPPSSSTGAVGTSTGSITSIISTTGVGTTGATEAPACISSFTNPVVGDPLLPNEGCVAISLDNTAAYVFGGTKLALLQQTLLKLDLATGVVAAVNTTGSPANTFIYNDCEAFIVDESGTETLHITSQSGGWKLDTSALAWSFVGIGKKSFSNLLLERAAAAMNRVYWYVANGVGLFRSTDGQLGSLGAPFASYDTIMHFSGTTSGTLIIYGGTTQALPTQNMWKGVLADNGTVATWTLLSSSTPVTAAFDPIRVRFAHLFQDTFASFHLGSSGVAFLGFDTSSSTWTGVSTSLRGSLPTFDPVLAGTDRTFLFRFLIVCLAKLVRSVSRLF